MNRLIIHCGSGRGKTSSAAGIALRSLAHGKKVFFAQFFKPQPDSALQFLQEKNADICVKNYGGWYFVDRPDENAKKVFENAIEEITRSLQNDDYSTIILDEIFYTVQFSLLDVKKIIKLIETFDNKCFVLTGRNAPDELLKIADTVSNIECIKHGFDCGIKAQCGIEF